MQKLVLRYGLIAGAILVVFMFFSFLLLGGSEEPNFQLMEIIGYLTMLIALSSIFIGIKKYRDEHLGGVISFAEGFKMGILISLVASILYVLGWLIISNTIAKDFGEQYFNYYIENLKASDLPEQELQERIESFEKNKDLYSNPLVQMGTSFLEIFPLGLIITLISALILRRK